MEIERKFLVNKIPSPLDAYKCRKIEQAYLCTSPVVRVRRDNDDYYLTYKSKGLLEREEYNLPLTSESYEHLKEKADGIIITKNRYEIPFNEYIIELDIFEGKYKGLVLAEVEFETREDAEKFSPPAWFKEDVTLNPEYSNSFLSKC
jgi:CYTH domain-containing protein